MTRSRGFTLIELMVGAVVSLLVIGAVMATFLTQQRSLQGLDLAREASNAQRDAMLSMQETIGRAGYGIDPRYAFDLRSYNCNNYTTATTAANACRDHVNAPDELVFVARDPSYYWAGGPITTNQGCADTADSACTGHAWTVKGFTTTSPFQVVITARANDNFVVGQLVEITCGKGNNPTMGQVKTRATAGAAGSLTITLIDPIANNHYTDALGATHDTCFDSGSAFPNNAAVGTSMFLVNRYRYFVSTINGDPWLMLDRGLDFNNNNKTPESSNGSDTADLIPIAHGVEGMQVSYLLRPDSTGASGAPDNNHNWVIGDTAGTVEEPDPTLTPPAQNTPDVDPLRFSKHPANIRGVRVRLTVRSLLTDRTQGSTFLGDPAVVAPATSIENRNDFSAVALGRFRRFFSSVVVATPNLNSKDPFIF